MGEYLDKVLTASSSFSTEDQAEIKEADKKYKIIIYLLAAIGILGVATSFTVFINAVILVFLLMMIYGLTNPLMGIFAISIFIVLDPIVRVYGSVGILRWNTINYWLIIFSIIHLQTFFTNFTKQIVTASIFFIVLVLQLGYAQNLILGIQQILGFASFLAFFIYFLSVKKYAPQIVLFYTNMVMGITSIITSSIFYYKNGFQAFDVMSKLRSGISMSDIDTINANAYAVMLVSSIMIAAVSYNIITDLKNKRKLLIVVLANLGMILFTGSRGALLIALFSLYFMLSKKKNLMMLFVYGLSFFFLLYFLSPIFKDSKNLIAQKVYILFQEDETAASKTNNRSAIARIGFEIFKDNPLGVGTGNFVYSFQEYSTKVDFEVSSGLEQGAFAAHSGLIKVMAENGILGMLSFAAFILSFYVKKSDINYSNGLFVIIISIITFLSAEFQHKPIWMVCAIVAYLNLAESKQLREKII